MNRKPQTANHEPQTVTRPPALVIEYSAPEEGFQGWLVMDTLYHRLSAGGMRVQKGLSRVHLVRMARNMTCKMRMCGLRVDGAKSGIDYDPSGPGKRAAMARFMAAIQPYISSRYSMGPDLNVEMAELESIGRDLGLPAVKIAVAGAQGWDLDYFRDRYRMLEREIEGFSLGRLRAGYGVAVAVCTVLDHLGLRCDQATVAIQGFGTLAKAAASTLDKKGVRIVAMADREKCLVAEDGAGLDIGRLLHAKGSLLPDREFGGDVRLADREEISRIPCDVLVPAAVENTITRTVAAQLQVRAVVPGANLAVTEAADSLLFERGIIVLPDLLSGCGGSLSMAGLFGPENHPGPEEVLAHVEKQMTTLVNQTLARSRSENIPPSLAALRICSEAVPVPGVKPYGDPT
jgi:glutamate dehydrogenase (NAD(P)+)